MYIFGLLYRKIIIIISGLCKIFSHTLANVHIRWFSKHSLDLVLDTESNSLIDDNCSGEKTLLTATPRRNAANDFAMRHPLSIEFIQS